MLSQRVIQGPPISGHLRSRKRVSTFEYSLAVWSLHRHGFVQIPLDRSLARQLPGRTGFQQGLTGFAMLQRNKS
jgi:hypothetical protein